MAASASPWMANHVDVYIVLIFGANGSGHGNEIRKMAIEL